MTEQRDLTLNLCMHQGRAVSDPVIVPMGTTNKCAFLEIKTFVYEQNPNGQWTTNPINVPLVVLDQKKVGVVEKYVKKGKMLLVRCYYKSWHDGQTDRHGMVVTKMDLGPMKADGRDEDMTGDLPIPD